MTDRQPEIARGHEVPFATQFSVFLANRVGQLKDLLDLAAREKLDLYAVSIIDSTDWAVIRTIFSDVDKAREILRRNGIPFTESEVLLAELPEEDSLSQICGILLSGEISVHFAYPLTIRSHDYPVMVFHVDDTVLATQMLMKHGFVLLGQEDLGDSGFQQS